MEIPELNWSYYEEYILKIGKKAPIINTNISKFYHILLFLNELKLIKLFDFIQEVVEKDISGVIESNKLAELTELGKNYYTQKHILNDEDTANEIFKNTLMQYRPVKMLTQTLYGKPNINRDNVKNLLCHYGFIDDSFNIGNFLLILNKFDILNYVKRTRKVKILVSPSESSEEGNYFVSKDKPFTNRMTLQRMIEGADEYIYWFEKHFSPKIYEYIALNADGDKVNEIKLLTGTAHISSDKRNSFKHLKEELSHKEIKIQHRIIIDKKILKGIHGRWILTGNKNYKIPPLNTILQGQTDEIILTENPPKFEQWWKKSQDLIDNWNKIKKEIGELNE